MSRQGIEGILGCLLDRGTGTEQDTHFFIGVSHDELVRRLIDYLNAHRHYLGYCQIEPCQALNDKGVDVFLRSSGCTVGFQIKSHFDVQEDDFASNVKRQFAEALSYGLDLYYILICSALVKEGKKDYRMKVAHLQNELRLFKAVRSETYGPLNTVVYFKGTIRVSREELLARKAIADDALHDYERGYEHLPEVDDKEVRLAKQRLDSFGSYWFELEQGDEAFRDLQDLIERKQAEQFESMFLPTFPSERARESRRPRLLASPWSGDAASSGSSPLEPSPRRSHSSTRSAYSDGGNSTTRRRSVPPPNASARV
jgi:hypothetical protein